jgi:hypothetical protein
LLPEYPHGLQVFFPYMLKTKALAAHDMLALLAAPRDKVAGRWVRRPRAR